MKHKEKYEKTRLVIIPRVCLIFNITYVCIKNEKIKSAKAIFYIGVTFHMSFTRRLLIRANKM